MPSLDWLWFLLWLLTFGVAMFYWRKWRDGEQARDDLQTESERAFHRLYQRYLVARQRAYTDYLDSTDAHTGQEFKFPTFAEWTEDRAETD